MIGNAWNSVELFKEYQAHGGFNLAQSDLMDNLCRHFDGVYSFYPHQVMQILSHLDVKHHSLLLKMMREYDDDIDNRIRNIAKQVIKECKYTPHYRSN